MLVVSTRPASVLSIPAVSPTLAEHPRRWPAVLAGLYASVTVVLLVGWATVGDAWWLQPFNLSTFWWTLLGLLLLVVAVLARSWLAALLLAVPGLAFVWIYGTLFVPQLADPPPADLVVATWNTYVQAPDEGHVVDLVDRVEPDVLLLQEVFPERQEQLEEALADRLPHIMTVQSDGGIGGVMVASRHPIVDERAVTTGDDDVRSTAVAVLDVDGQEVQVAPVHLRSPCPTCGASLTERLTLEGQSRAFEMANVLGQLDRGTPAIVAGDFNSTERSAAYRTLASAGFDDAHRSAGWGPGFTWPADGRLPVAVVRIDWVFARDLVAVDEWVDEAGPSDHRPVVATFAFEEG